MVAFPHKGFKVILLAIGLSLVLVKVAREEGGAAGGADKVLWMPVLMRKTMWGEFVWLTFPRAFDLSFFSSLSIFLFLSFLYSAFLYASLFLKLFLFFFKEKEFEYLSKLRDDL